MHGAYAPIHARLILLPDSCACLAYAHAWPLSMPGLTLMPGLCSCLTARLPACPPAEPNEEELARLEAEAEAAMAAFEDDGDGETGGRGLQL